LFNQARDGDGSRKADGEMHMILHAARPVTFTAGVAGHGREIRMEFGPRVRVEEWVAILRAKDDVDDDERERLGHGDDFRAKGPFNTSLGQRPRKTVPNISPSANGAIHLPGAVGVVVTMDA